MCLELDLKDLILHLSLPHNESLCPTPFCSGGISDDDLFGLADDKDYKPDKGKGDEVLNWALHTEGVAEPERSIWVGTETTGRQSQPD